MQELTCHLLFFCLVAESLRSARNLVSLAILQEEIRSTQVASGHMTNPVLAGSRPAGLSYITSGT